MIATASTRAVELADRYYPGADVMPPVLRTDGHLEWPLCRRIPEPWGLQVYVVGYLHAVAPTLGADGRPLLHDDLEGWAGGLD